MKYHMFSVYDEKAKAYLPPFILPEVRNGNQNIWRLRKQ